jgi:hypothetical protein
MTQEQLKRLQEVEELFTNQDLDGAMVQRIISDAIDELEDTLWRAAKVVQGGEQWECAKPMQHGQFIIMVRENEYDAWRPCAEGAFDTFERAQEFARAEVGWGWNIVEVMSTEGQDGGQDAGQAKRGHYSVMFTNTAGLTECLFESPDTTEAEMYSHVTAVEMVLQMTHGTGTIELDGNGYVRSIVYRDGVRTDFD